MMDTPQTPEESVVAVAELYVRVEYLRYRLEQIKARRDGA